MPQDDGPEALYAMTQPVLKEAGERRCCYRCDDCKQWQVDAWDVRGRLLVRAAKVKMSPGYAEANGIPQIPGRAWFVSDLPVEPIWLGCRCEPQMGLIRDRLRL